MAASPAAAWDVCMLLHITYALYAHVVCKSRASSVLSEAKRPSESGTAYVLLHHRRYAVCVQTSHLFPITADFAGDSVVRSVFLSGTLARWAKFPERECSLLPGRRRIGPCIRADAGQVNDRVRPVTSQALRGEGLEQMLAQIPGSTRVRCEHLPRNACQMKN